MARGHQRPRALIGRDAIGRHGQTGLRRRSKRRAGRGEKKGFFFHV